MRNLVNYIPLTNGLFNMKNLSLCGLVYMGFILKNLILETFLIRKNNFINLRYIIFLARGFIFLGLLMTEIYISRSE